MWFINSIYEGASWNFDSNLKIVKSTEHLFRILFITFIF